MKTRHLIPGLAVRIAIGGRLHPVTVIGHTGAGRSIIHTVRTDAGKLHKLPASKIWPMPESVIDGWETTGEEIVAPGAVAGVRINRRRMIERVCRENVRRIADACGRVHVGESPLATVRAVYAAAGKRSLRSAPPAFRRGVVRQILACRAANVAEYRAVMGHAPLPTEAQITAAMLACR